MIGTGDVLWVELPVQRRLCPIFVSRVGLLNIHEYSAGRDKHLLHAHGVDALYETKELPHKEATLLFTRHAFKQEVSVQDCMVHYA